MLAWSAAPEHRCHRCSSKARLVAYRRNGGTEEWTCASCAGTPMERAFGNGYDASRTVTGARPPPKPVSEPRLDRPAEMPRRYLGPRARHDPLR